jgi:hypothetical protein
VLVELGLVVQRYKAVLEVLNDGATLTGPSGMQINPCASSVVWV